MLRSAYRRAVYGLAAALVLSTTINLSAQDFQPRSPHLAPLPLRLAALPTDRAGDPRAAPALEGGFRLDWSCGHLYEELDEPAFETCGRPWKDTMQRPIDRVRAAAERGSAYDQFILGMAYWQGDRAPRDPVRALIWLSLAAERGQAAAMAARSTLAAQLSPAQIAAAERLAKGWRARHRADR